MFRKKQHAQAAAQLPAVLRCSFCNKDQHDVRKLVAGPTVFICDECIDICRQIMADDEVSETAEANDDGPVNPFPDVVASGPVILCTLCGIPIVLSDGLPVRNRGILCLGCVGEVEAAVAERRESGL